MPRRSSASIIGSVGSLLPASAQRRSSMIVGVSSIIALIAYSRGGQNADALQFATRLLKRA